MFGRVFKGFKSVWGLLTGLFQEPQDSREEEPVGDSPVPQEVPAEMASPRPQEGSISDRLIQESLGSAEGRTRLAQAMMAPLRRGLDYRGLGRSLLGVEQLPTGAAPIYDTQPPGIVGTRVGVPTFELYSNPTVAMGGVRARRFSLIDREQRMAEEDANVFSILDRIALDLDRIAFDTYPEWARMGMWIRHKTFGIWAQIIDADDGVAIIDPWEGHAVIPELELRGAAGGGFLASSDEIQSNWSPSEEPISYPSAWDHILDDVL